MKKWIKAIIFFFVCMLVWNLMIKFIIIGELDEAIKIMLDRLGLIYSILFAIAYLFFLDKVEEKEEGE